MADSTLDDISIQEVDLDRITPDDGPRVYYNDEYTLPSVSTVLNVRPDPPALAAYKDRHKDDEGYTDFYTDRGTLAHYELLNPLTDEELWTDDEEESECGMKQHQEYWDQYQEDLEWLNETWDLICTLRDIEPDNVLAVEHYIANFEVGYGGQLDLLWVDGNGDLILGDIKTSKDVYDKYLYQAVAYDHALDVTVDRYEILRLHPGQRVWEISRSDEWVDSIDDLWEEFKGFREKLDDDRLQEIREQAES